MATRLGRADVWWQQRKHRGISAGTQLTPQTYTRTGVQSVQQRLLGSARWRQRIDPTQHADAAGRTTTSATANFRMRNTGAAARIYDRLAHSHPSDTCA